jgi:radical SAM superfamily enzyme
MENARLRFEDILECASNFNPWIERIALVLEEQGIWKFVEGTPIPPAYPSQIVSHIRRDVKERRIIIDGVKDHIILHFSGKNTTKEMWESLTKLYQLDNQSIKMMLREKLKSTKMAKSDFVASYLTKFTQIIDELATVGEVVDETKLVRISLNSFTKK